MKATDGNGPDWEAVARKQLMRDGDQVARDLQAAIGQAAHAFGEGNCTAQEIQDARDCLNRGLFYVEDDLAPLVDGVDKHGRGDYAVNMGSAADMLDISLAQADEARDGALLEIGEAVIRELTRGNNVQVRTSGGIDVELQPQSFGDTETGP